VVEECSDPAWVGQRVCGEINIGCGTCQLCRAGMHAHCASRTVVGILGRPGAFAEFLSVPVSTLHRVPHSVEDERAVFVEPLAAAFRILEQVTVGPEDRVAVLGDGRLGILCARVLARTGGRVTAVGKHREKLGLLARSGVTTVLAGAEAGAERFDLVVEATGTSGGFERALEMVRPLGTLVLKSTAADPATLDLAPVVVKEVRVIGSRCGPFPTAIDALARDRVEVRDLITARYRLEDAVAAFQRAQAPGVLKVLLEGPAATIGRGGDARAAR
jgi:2-desacetyl-2-hydroxyethyl bacteriochlorophyllide A dehydrogenase